MIINEQIDSWIRTIFLWTFEHEFISGLFIATPIVFWVAGGLFFILIYGGVNEGKPNHDKRMIIIFTTYLVAPFSYLIITGYIGYLVFG